jgi:hypothetical protein
MGISLIAHELAHPLITRSLHQANVLAEMRYPPYTREETVRFVSLSLFEEYHADRLSDFVLGLLATVTIDQENRKARSWDLYGPDMETTLEEVLAATYPEWADRVLGYISGQEDLSNMFRHVNEMILGTLMTLIHAQTSADGAGQHKLLKHHNLAELPAVRLYLQDEWTEMLEALDQAPLAPASDEVRPAVEGAFTAGDSLLTAVWSRLGLEPEDQEDGSLYLHVYHPTYLRDGD